MRLEVINNKETSLVIDDVGRAVGENGYLGKGYMKAIMALEEYMNQTRLLRAQVEKISDNSSAVNNLLYRSPQNIIAFCGKRGAGKTSSMLSFAEFLEKEQMPDSYGKTLKDQHLAGLRVTVLSPLDPTMLENKQNILSIVLSRLLFKAEERWSTMMGSQQYYRNKEESKNRLLMVGNECLNGIKAVKQVENLETLSDLQRIGDSAILKKNLYDFVNMVNTFCMEQEAMSSCRDYLIIPIDDTDCQIQKAYDVMEDIRRYLTLPNVIILMATDVDLLRTLTAQHYADEFEIGIGRQYIYGEEMPHMAEKYLTKIIPTTHRIYLPSFETIIQDHSEKLEFGYYDSLESQYDIITETTPEKREKLRRIKPESLDFDFQSKVLYYIYRKTGIVFISHSSYINNIIPTTMRGLAHMLSILSKMPDVVEKEKIAEDITPAELADRLEGRIKRARRNMDIFEEYFMNEWIPTKVDMAMGDLMEGLERQVPEKSISFAFDKILNVYKALKGITIPKSSYYSLMDILSKINGLIKTNENMDTYDRMTDYYNVSAVRFLLTIKNNRQALIIKQEGINRWKSLKGAEAEKPLVFDMDILGTQDSFPRKSYKDTEYAYKMMPVIEAFRRFLLSGADWEGKNQFEIFKIQEAAWKVLCNWDVQDAVYKIVDEYVQNGDLPSPEELWAIICRRLSEKNCGMISDFVNDNLMPSDIWLTSYKDLTTQQGPLLIPPFWDKHWGSENGLNVFPDADAAEGGKDNVAFLTSCLADLKKVLDRRALFNVKDLLEVMASLHRLLFKIWMEDDSSADDEAGLSKFDRIGDLMQKCSDLRDEVEKLSEKEGEELDKKDLASLKKRIRMLINDVEVVFGLDL